MSEKETKRTTPKKTATKKAPVKKVAPKKVENPKAEVTEEVVTEIEEVVEETPQVTAKPARQKRIEIDRNELIACRSMTNGKLIYISNRSGAKYIWQDYGSVEYIDMGELLTLKSSQPAFLNNVMFVVDDEEAVTYLGLNHLYETVFELDDLDAFFEKPIEKLEEILPKLPKGLKDTVATRARQLIEEGALDSNNKIKLIEEKLKVDLKIFEK